MHGRETSFEGWDSGPVAGAALTEAIERAFDYRGDVTLTLTDGTQVAGYLYNREWDSPAPFVELFEGAGGARKRVPNAAITRIHFTGRDTAAGTSYAAWVRSREAARAATSPGA